MYCFCTLSITVEAQRSSFPLRVDCHNIPETTPWSTNWSQINHLRKDGTIAEEWYMALKYFSPFRLQNEAFPPKPAHSLNSVNVITRALNFTSGKFNFVLVFSRTIRDVLHTACSCLNQQRASTLWAVPNQPRNHESEQSVPGTAVATVTTAMARTSGCDRGITSTPEFVASYCLSLLPPDSEQKGGCAWSLVIPQSNTSSGFPCKTLACKIGTGTGNAVTHLPDAPVLSQPWNPLPSTSFISFTQNSGAQR